MNSGSKSTNAQEGSKTDAGTYIRQQFGVAMVEATGWAEEHRRLLALGSLAGVACGAALLIRVYGIPGVTRITSNAQLAARLQQQHENSRGLACVRLPVILAGTKIKDGHLLIEAVHYPTLLKWYDRYKGRPATRLLPTMKKSQQNAVAASSDSIAATGGTAAAMPHEQDSQADTTSCYGTAGDRSSGSTTARDWRRRPGSLYCYIAGMQDVQPAVQSLLQQQLLSSPTRIHSLRVFAVTRQHQQGREPTTSRGSGASDTAGIKEKDGGMLADLHVPQRHGTTSNAESAGTARTDPVGSADYASTVSKKASLGDNNNSKSDGTAYCEDEDVILWAELRLLGGLPTAQLKAAAKALMSVSTQDLPKHTQAIAVAPQSGLRHKWLVLRKRDLTEQLLKYGLARLAAQEDFEWLGVRASAVRAYLRAAEYAKAKRLGVHKGILASSSSGFINYLRFWWLRLSGRGSTSR